MKKKWSISLGVILVVILWLISTIAAALVVSEAFRPRLSVVSTPTLEKKTQGIVQYAPYRKHWASSYNGNLLFCESLENKYGLKSSYADWLCVVEDGEIKKLLNFSPNGCPYRILGQVDQWIYYTRSEIFFFSAINPKLYCFDLEQGTETLLYSNTSLVNIWHGYQSNDGNLYVKVEENGEYKLFRVRDGAIVEKDIYRVDVQLDSGEYAFDLDSRFSAYALDANGEVQERLHWGVAIPTFSPLQANYFG